MPPLTVNDEQGPLFTFICRLWLDNAASYAPELTWAPSSLNSESWGRLEADGEGLLS